MFARMSRVQVPLDQLDRRIAEYPERMAALTELDGSIGLALLVDRSSGEAISVSYWATAEAMQASEDVAASIRASAAADGTQVQDVDRVELVIVERAAPPRSGSFVRVNDFQGTPETADDTIAFAREHVLPLLEQQPGFRANLVGVNRETGRIIASSVWDTAADREATEGAVQDLRRQAGRLAGGNVTVRLYEGVYVSVKVPEPA